MPSPASPPGTKPDIGATMRTASMIWQSVSEVAAGAIIGWLLDMAFETDRIFLLIGGLIGIGVGFLGGCLSVVSEVGSCGG